MKFEKPALPIPELLGKWRDRGLQIQEGPRRHLTSNTV